MAKYVLPISSDEAGLARAGGKGRNLAELVRAGFAVPPGYIITTDAYRHFVEANHIQERIIVLAKAISPNDLSALETTAAQICALFEGGTVSEELAGEVTSAYRAMAYEHPGSMNDPRSGPPVAVRSSATAEDLPDLAFAGQQDTYLNVIGESELIDAVKRCWASLWTARAMAYRARNHIPPDDVALAVVVQQMVQSEVSGVAFTANPVTGHRGEIVIDASFGLGEAVVSGLVDPDHYAVRTEDLTVTGRKLGAKEIAVVPRADRGGGTRRVERAMNGAREDRGQRGEAGRGGWGNQGGRGEQALPDEQIIELARTAKQVEELFGSPQDIEWAFAEGRLYLLQSRPITSLYPLPPLPVGAKRNEQREDGPRLYVNFNSIQGVTGPFTPVGIDALRLVFGGVRDLLRIQSPPRHFLPDAGGRLFIDFTEPVRDPRLRRVVPAFLANIDPGAQQTLLRLIKEGRFAPKVVLTPRRALLLLWGVLPLLRTVLRALLRPERVRPRVLADADRFVAGVEAHARASKGLSSLLRAMERDLPRAERVSLAVMPTVLPAVGAVPLVDRWLTRWLGEPPGSALQLMRGLPGNITIEMNLKLWAAAQQIRADETALDFVLTQPVEALVRAYRRGELPSTAQRAIERFLSEYGMRGVAEIDLGRPRWRDDPTQIIATLLGYLQLDDPKLAPDALYRRAAEDAERLAAEYVARASKTPLGWLRARLLAAIVRRMRILGGLREAPLVYLARVNDIYRTALLESARQLVAEGKLDRPEDIFFVPLATLKRFAQEGVQARRIDLRAVVTANRADYDREGARRQVPRILLSTGEAFYEGMSGTSETSGTSGTGGTEANANELVGEAVSPGVAEGRARVILDPQGARLEPGEILVCPSTDPGWTPLFLTAGGLVMEIGGLVTHGSVVAREYGIPAVVGVHEATTRLETGQQIRVDGNRGRVAVVE